MPELPEVENFRQLLLPLVSSSSPVNNNNNKKKKKNDTDDDDFLHLERLNLDKKPPRKFLSDEDIETINQHQYYVQDVLRRGKLICMVLESSSSGSSSGSKEEEEEDETTTSKTKYLYIHMGMTGRISTSDYVPNLVELKKDSEYPPPHTYLKFSTTKHEACFSDPRKFGSILLQSNKDEFDQLAPDALMEIIIMEDDNETDNNNDKKKKEEEEEEDDVKKKKKKKQTTTPAAVTVVKPEIITQLTNQSMGIKPLLLNQKRVISGVGNWVADEVLYQTQIHPDQNYLSQEESHTLLLKLYHILQVAVNCLLSKKQFPKEWLFNYRWNSKQTTKDVHGRTVTFITSGGRTSAIVPSIQKKKGRKKLAAAATTTTTTKETNTTAANKNTKKKKRRQKEEEEPVALNDDDSSDDEDTNKKPKAKKIKKSTTAAAAVGSSSSSNDKKIIKKKDTSESSSRNPPTTKKKKTNNKQGGKKQKASPPDLAQTAGGGNRRRSPRFSDAS